MLIHKIGSNNFILSVHSLFQKVDTEGASAALYTCIWGTSGSYLGRVIGHHGKVLLLLLLLFTATELSLGGSSPYTSTDKTNKNKCT